LNWLVRLIINGLALLVADQFISGFAIRGFTSAIIAVLILGIINTFIRPIFLFFTLPITVMSLGLFILIINAITFSMTAWLVDGFTIYSFSGAFWGAIVTSITSWLLNNMAKNN